VVALAILALSLAVIYQSYGWALHRSATVRSKEMAWMIAQSTLAGLRTSRSFASSSSRSPEGFDLTTTVTPYPASIDSKSRFKVYEIAIVVSWGNGPARRVNLNSLEIADAQP